MNQIQLLTVLSGWMPTLWVRGNEREGVAVSLRGAQTKTAGGPQSRKKKAPNL